MTVNGCSYEFRLALDGWHAGEPYQITSAADVVKEDLIVVAVVEFGSDDKPDIWYKAALLHVCADNKSAAKDAFEKYGLPKLVEDKCWAQKEALRTEICKSLEASA